MKNSRIVSAALALCMSVCTVPGTVLTAAAPISASAGYGSFEKVTEGAVTYYVSSDSAQAVKCDPSAEGSIVIPEQVGGVPVTSVDNSIFSGCTRITSVTVPEGVTLIGANAFKDCTSLTEVSLPGTVEAIGDSAFSGCTSLTAAPIPEGVKRIGDSAFSGCTALETVVIPYTVTKIYNSAFAGCTSLTSAKIEGDLQSVRTIPNYLFSGCTALESVVLPAVTKINMRAFDGCDSLSEVYYAGFQSMWDEVEINNAYNGNDALLNAEIHFMGAESAEQLSGDANGDGKVNISDAVAVLQYLANSAKYPLTGQGLISADCDGESGITGQDAIAIQRYDAKEITSLPVVK